MKKSSRQNSSLRLTQRQSHEKRILLDLLMPAFTPLTFTWCNHDFIFLGADPQECEVILGINVSHSAPCLHDEAVHEARILNCCRVVHSTFDRNTCKKQGTARVSDITPELTLPWASLGPAGVAV